MFVVGVMIIWCSFDVAGRDWVKLKKYQKSLKNQAWMTTSYNWQPLKRIERKDQRKVDRKSPPSLPFAEGASQQPVARQQGEEQGADGLQEVGQQPEQELEAPVRIFCVICRKSPK